MTAPRVAPPEPDEYAPFYAGYIARIRDIDPIALLAQQPSVLRAACVGLTDAAAHFRYAPGKWSVKQVLGHLGDVERVLSYRLFRIGRGDATPLSGFDENAYVDVSGSDERTLSALVDDFERARASTLQIVDGMRTDAWMRRGVANGAPVSARALLFILGGHVEHHCAILRERYGVTVPHPGGASA